MTPLFPKAGFPFLKILSPDSTGTDASASVPVFGLDFKLWYIALRWMATVGAVINRPAVQCCQFAWHLCEFVPVFCAGGYYLPLRRGLQLISKLQSERQKPWGISQGFLDHRECPLLRMTAMTLSTMVSQVSLLSASTMTRIRGSVPDSRTRIRPESPRAAAASATAFCTSGSF